MTQENQNLPQPTNRTIVSLFSEEELKKLSLEERLNYINKLLDKLEEPNILEQLFMGRKREASAIQEAKTLAIKARSEIIEALGNSLRISVKQEEGMLGSRYSANLIATSEVLTRNMNKVNEQAIDLLVDDYQETVASLGTRQGLEDTLKEALLTQAKDRLYQRQSDTYEGFKNLLAQYRHLVGELVGSIRKTS
ncbi:MAG: hypothetical protein V1885_02545 [Candidatus Brennerbacteria bacterium]